MRKSKTPFSRLLMFLTNGVSENRKIHNSGMESLCICLLLHIAFIFLHVTQEKGGGII